MGVIAAVLAFGAGLALVLAGPIVEHLGVHWLFWIPLMVAGVGMVMAYFFVPESPVRTPGGVSWLAALLLSGWLVALLVGVSEAPVWGWGSGRVLGLLALAVVIGVLWVVVELRVRSPLIDMRMMRVPAVWTNNLVAFLFGVGMYSVMTFLPEFLRDADVVGVRVRGECHSVGPLPPAPDRDDVRRRPLHRQDRCRDRVEGGRRLRIVRLHGVLLHPGVRP